MLESLVAGELRFQCGELSPLMHGPQPAGGIVEGLDRVACRPVHLEGNWGLPELAVLWGIPLLGILLFHPLEQFFVYAQHPAVGQEPARLHILAISVQLQPMVAPRSNILLASGVHNRPGLPCDLDHLLRVYGRALHENALRVHDFPRLGQRLHGFGVEQKVGVPQGRPSQGLLLRHRFVRPCCVLCLGSYYVLGDPLEKLVGMFLDVRDWGCSLPIHFRHYRWSSPNDIKFLWSCPEIAQLLNHAYGNPAARRLADYSKWATEVRVQALIVLNHLMIELLLQQLDIL
mmetsp:Transcript_28064/g.60951  ORF Transcript_28064/g.60951 Transcript_28064/m.60951 type:complete len:288 (-) Transcript_28064:261-1124(-)